MTRDRTLVYQDGRYLGKTLREWLPEVVDRVVEGFDPVRVILFGSLARGEEGPDSDIDLVVVLDGVDHEHKHRLMARIRRAIGAPVPIDVVVTDPREIARRKDVIGSVLYWPMREGVVLYERAP